MEHRLWVFLAIFVILTVSTWDGYGPRDAERYIRAALSWSEDGNPIGSNHWALRWPLIAPMAAVFGIFGPSAIGASVPNMLYGAGLVIVSHVYARRLMPRFTADILALFIATSGLFALQINEIRVYGMEMFFTAWAIWAMLAAIKTDSERDRFYQLLMSGFAVGGAWLCRESSFYLGPFLLIVGLVSFKQPIRTLLPFAAAAGGVLVVELLSYWLVTGDPMWRVDKSMNHGRGNANTEPFEFVGEDESVSWYFLHPWAKLASYPTLTPIIGLAIIALIAARVKRWPLPGFTLAVFFIGGAIAFLGNGYLLSLETAEYYTILCYASYVALAVVAAQVMTMGTTWRRWAAAGVAFVVLTNFAGESFRDDNEYREANAITAEILRRDEPIIVDVATQLRVHLLLELEGVSPEEAERLAPRWLKGDPATEGLLFVGSPIGPFYMIGSVPEECTVIEKRRIRDNGWSKGMVRRLFLLFNLEKSLPGPLKRPPPAVLCDLNATANS